MLDYSGAGWMLLARGGLIRALCVLFFWAIIPLTQCSAVRVIKTSARKPDGRILYSVEPGCSALWEMAACALLGQRGNYHHQY
jgi:hypothetical protein